MSEVSSKKALSHVDYWGLIKKIAETVLERKKEERDFIGIILRGERKGLVLGVQRDLKEKLDELSRGGVSVEYEDLSVNSTVNFTMARHLYFYSDRIRSFPRRVYLIYDPLCKSKVTGENACILDLDDVGEYVEERGIY